MIEDYDKGYFDALVDLDIVMNNKSLDYLKSYILKKTARYYKKQEGGNSK